VLAASTRAVKAAPSDRVNMGFIGMGIRGNHLLRSFLKFPEVNPVAVADLYDGYLENAREVTDGKVGTAKDYRAVLDRKDVDAVTVATPDHWHTRMVLDAIGAGKDVYCEKPMTWSVEEGYRIMKAMKNSDRILQIGSEPKSSATTAKAREIVKSGVLGKINLVRAADYRNSQDGAWVYPIPPDASPETVDWNRFLGSAAKIPWSPERFFRWRCWWEYSGGIATDMFVHMLTTLHEILDAKLPKSVASSGGIYRWNDGRTVPDMLLSVFEYPGDYQMELLVNFASSKGRVISRGMTIMGSEATLVIGGPDGGLALYREDPNQVDKQYAGQFPRRLKAQFDAEQREKPVLPKPQEMEVIEVARDPNRPTHMGFFLKSVKDRTASVEDAEAGHNAACAAHMANHAFRHRSMAGLDATTGQLVAR
jgi:predicted dehydrogenase